MSASRVQSFYRIAKPLSSGLGCNHQVSRKVIKRASASVNLEQKQQRLQFSTKSKYPPPRPLPQLNDDNQVIQDTKQKEQAKEQKQQTKKTAFSWVMLCTMSLTLGYGIGSFNDMPPGPPPLPDTEEGRQITQNIENQLNSLPIVKKLREEKVQGEGWYETRPYGNFPEEKRLQSLTAGTLRGPGKMAVPGLCFSSSKNDENIIVLHVGHNLCGHEGLIHGGLLGTLLDEGLGRPSILSLPSKIGVTAYLNINYRSPAKANQFLVLRSKCTEVKGRKAFSKGSLETLDGKILVEADALFVEPKGAKFWVGKSSVRQALGDK